VTRPKAARLTIGGLACEMSGKSYQFGMRQGGDMPGSTKPRAVDEASITPHIERSIGEAKRVIDKRADA
jgi:hypothetical protein